MQGWQATSKSAMAAVIKDICSLPPGPGGTIVEVAAAGMQASN